MAKRQRRSSSFTGEMIKTGVTNLVGVGLIGATAGMVNDLPAGTTKTIAGMAPAFQSVALLGPNIKLVKKTKKFW